MAANAAATKANQTPTQRAERLRQKATHDAEMRSNRTQEEIENRNCQNAAHMAEVRANQTPDERQNANLHQREARNRVKTHVEFKDAMRTDDILRGTFNVAALHETNDRIGTMTIECPDCKALKFPGETPSSCCQSGKVVLLPYPRPPEPILPVLEHDISGLSGRPRYLISSRIF